MMPARKVAVISGGRQGPLAAQGPDFLRQGLFHQSEAAVRRLVTVFLTNSPFKILTVGRFYPMVP